MKKNYRRDRLDDGLDTEFDTIDATEFNRGTSFARRDSVADELDEEVIEVDDLDIEEGDLEDLNEEVESTDDPVRMYLMQMGQIPLLTRDEELSSARKIKKTRGKYRHWVLATDFMHQGACKLLEQARDSKLRLDRTIEVSVTNAAEKKNQKKKAGEAVPTPSEKVKPLCSTSASSSHR